MRSSLWFIVAYYSIYCIHNEWWRKLLILFRDCWVSWVNLRQVANLRHHSVSSLHCFVFTYNSANLNISVLNLFVLYLCHTLLYLKTSVVDLITCLKAYLEFINMYLLLLSNDSTDGEPEEKRRKVANVVINQPATDSKTLVENAQEEVWYIVVQLAGEIILFFSRVIWNKIPSCGQIL